MKRLKNMRLICLWDTGSSVFKAQASGCGTTGRLKGIAGDRQPTAVRHRVECILNNVIDHLRQAVSITGHNDGPRQYLRRDLHAPATSQISEESNTTTNEFAKINCTAFESLRTSEFQQPTHECVQPIYLGSYHVKSRG